MVMLAQINLLAQKSMYKKNTPLIMRTKNNQPYNNRSEKREPERKQASECWPAER